MVPGRPDESTYSSMIEHMYSRMLRLPKSTNSLATTIVGNITPPPCIPVDHTFGIGKLSEVEKSSLFQPPRSGESGQQSEGSDPHLGDLPCKLSAQLQGAEGAEAGGWLLLTAVVCTPFNCNFLGRWYGVIVDCP